MSQGVSTSAYICLGSNEGDTKEHLQHALDVMLQAQGIRLGSASPLYYTEPQGLKEQAWFCNQVVRLECDATWTSHGLMRLLLSIEESLGRQRSQDPALRFGPRIIDLDILLFGQEQSQDNFCTLPHPRMLERAFVLIPLRHVLCQGTLLAPQELEKALESLTYTLDRQKIYQ